MKKIQTKYFGEAEVDEADLLVFDEGLWGFEQYKRFALLPFDEDGEGLMCLQSDEEPSLAFVVLDPFAIRPDYAPRLEESDEKALEIDPQTPVSLLAVVVVKESLESSTANLRCPIVVNGATRRARQVALADAYPLRCPIAAEKEA